MMPPASVYLRLFSLNKDPHQPRLTRQQALSSTLSFDKSSTLQQDLADCHLIENMALTFTAKHEHGHGKSEWTNPRVGVAGYLLLLCIGAGKLLGSNDRSR